MSDAVLHASKHDVFCGDCAFYEPGSPYVLGSHFQRCRHPSAVQEVKTYVGLAKRFIEPEDKNAHNDCPDFKARPAPKLSREWVLGLGLVGLPVLAITAGRLFGFDPWLAVIVGAAILLWPLMR